jgi:imidazole glycerol-phosphate synthase subunit HisH
MIAIVDDDLGNVGSIRNMLRTLGHDATVTADHATLRAAAGIILPGVGAFDSGIGSLRERGLFDTLRQAALERGTPMLGICLGMQLLTNGSEEGNLPGLGLVDAYTRKFSLPAGSALRIPHMGWNEISVRRGGSVDSSASLCERLFAETEPDQRYYFVHSYHVCGERPADVLATATYGIEFTAAIGSGNIAGTQFHPEKSLRFGMRVMKNFVACCTAAVPCLGASSLDDARDGPARSRNAPPGLLVGS